MPPKKRAAAGKRALSSVPESETASGIRETRSRSKRPRFADDSLSEEDSRTTIVCPEDDIEPTATRSRQEEPTTGRRWKIACGWPATSSKFGKNDLTDEETLDWYMDAALKEVKGVLRLAREDKLRQADLWNLLTFGQHMYSGIKQFYGVDLNDALLEKEKSNMGKEAELGPARLPWPRPVPRRCGSCSRVGTTYVTPEHPWNRTSFSRLYPEEGRYETGGQSGFDHLLPGIDPFTYPEQMGTTYRGWNA